MAKEYRSPIKIYSRDLMSLACRYCPQTLPTSTWWASHRQYHHQSHFYILFHVHFATGWFSSLFWIAKYCYLLWPKQTADDHPSSSVLINNNKQEQLFDIRLHRHRIGEYVELSSFGDWTDSVAHGVGIYRFRSHPIRKLCRAFNPSVMWSTYQSQDDLPEVVAEAQVQPELEIG